MKIYVWESTLLEDYGKGHLIAMAETAEEARTKLRAGFDSWVKENRTWIWDEAHATWGGEPDTVDFDELHEKFEADLKRDPTEHETLWISGTQ